MFNSAPVVFRRGERDLVAITGGDGRLYVLDSGALGGADHRTPMLVIRPDPSRVQRPVAGRWFRSPGLSTWEDGPAQWILAAEADGIAAFRVSSDGGAVVAERAWQSRPLVAPLAPIVVNGVVFVVSSGEFHGGGASMTAKERADRSTPAVLYALDAVTGKELWTSGTTITSFARAGLSAGGGRVYVVTYDNTLYTFGVPMEH
jgi:outer membrane protein assembly factor BamB